MKHFQYEDAQSEASFNRTVLVSNLLSKILKNDGKLTAMIIGVCLGCLVTIATVSLTHNNDNVPKETENMIGQSKDETLASTPSLTPNTNMTAPLGATPLPMQTLTTVVEGTPIEWSTSTTRSGYPIYTSGAPRAIDWQGENPLPYDPCHTIGRNGLMGNPPVDPPSCHGRAYSMSYPVAPQ